MRKLPNNKLERSVNRRWPHHARNGLRARAPPPVFAFGDIPSIFFTDAYVSRVKEAKLKGFSFNPVAEVGHG